MGVAAAAPRPLAVNADEVLARNAAARGGLEAWRKVETLTWLGHIERTDPQGVATVPFAMQLKRPNLTRFELKEQFDHFTRIFDGNHGWKVRPAGDGRPETKAFSPEEVTFARSEFVVDGPLLDYRGKGVTVSLDGLDIIEGKKAYRLSLTLPSGAERKVWIDTRNNLEIRYDRPATNPLAPGAPISVYYRDYQSQEGLMMPRRIETGVGANGVAGASGETLVIDRVLVNPTLDETTFHPPAVPIRRGGLIRIPGPGTPETPGP